MTLPITITLTRYAEPNWLLAETLESLALQKNITARVLMLDQQNNAETALLCKQLTNENITFDYHTIPAKSLSYARNEAIKLCETDILLYIDTDAIAAPDWAEKLSEALSQENVGIAGGKIIPKWHKTPSFIQKSQVVLDQYSMLDLGEKTIEVSRVVGANFGLNKARLGKLANFDENLGRREGKLYSGEESKLCHDATANGFKILYQGSALVQHQVLPERIKFSWIATRMYYQGMASAKRGGAPNPSNKGKYTVWDYLALVALAPFYIYGYLKAR
ncbi:glycosyltransferase family 2 protein [Thalassotalea agariperforans]